MERAFLGGEVLFLCAVVEVGETDAWGEEAS